MALCWSDLLSKPRLMARRRLTYGGSSRYRLVQPNEFVLDTNTLGDRDITLAKWLTRLLALTCAIAAISGTALSLVWWVTPTLFASFVEPILLGEFAVAAVILGILSLVIGGGRLSNAVIRMLFATLPRALAVGVWSLSALAIGSCLGSFITARGYSQNPEATLGACRWSIGDNHGLTNKCVSHAQWLATGEAVQRGIVALVAVFLAVEAGVCVSMARRKQRRTLPDPAAMRS